MKRTITICGIFLLLICCLCSCHRYQYPIGRDTAYAWGDSAIQVLRGVTDGEEELSLSNAKYVGNNFIISRVQRIYETEHLVYFVGFDAHYSPENITNVNLDNPRFGFELCAIVDIDTNVCRLCAMPVGRKDEVLDLYYYDEMIENGDLVMVEEFTDFSADDQAIFSEMWANRLGEAP